jgi:hypothetical protein
MSSIWTEHCYYYFRWIVDEVNKEIIENSKLFIEFALGFVFQISFLKKKIVFTSAYAFWFILY